MIYIIPKHAVISGASALFFYGLIDFNPNKKVISVKRGTNISKPYFDNFKVSSENEITLKIGIDKKIKDKKIFCKERLFIELDSFDLELTIYNQAKKNLLKIIDPYRVFKIYNQLKKNKKRKIDYEKIEKYLEKNLILINEKIEKLFIEKNESKIFDILREYVISIIGKNNNLPILLKGGSAIELFVNIKRSTLDIDTHIKDDATIEKILSKLENKKNEIYFYCETKTKKNQSKKIISYSLFPKSYSSKIREIFKKINKVKEKNETKTSIKITFNKSINLDEIKELIKEFKITKKKLKILNQNSFLIFSLEMLLAEKFYSIITKPEITSRTKDLIDLYLLFKQNKKIIDFQKIKKWFLKKHKYSRNKKEIKINKEFIKENLNKDLIKIKKNFLKASKMYEINNVLYEDAHKIYLYIGEKFLEIL